MNTVTDPVYVYVEELGEFRNVNYNQLEAEPNAKPWLMPYRYLKNKKSEKLQNTNKNGMFNQTKTNHVMIYHFFFVGAKKVNENMKLCNTNNNYRSTEIVNEDENSFSKYLMDKNNNSNIDNTVCVMQVSINKC